MTYSTKRLRTGFDKYVGHNLTEHLYANWIERPAWRYIGADRRDAAGRPRNPGAFSVTHYGTPGIAFTWTIQDQTWAIENGFFIHRSGLNERVNIVWIDRFHHDTDDGHASIAYMERMVFEHALDYPNMWNRLWRFIKQQDQFGYTGAWDKRVQFFSNKLTWYREYRLVKIDPSHLSKRDQTLRVKALKRIESVKVARRHAFASYVRNNFIRKVVVI